MKKIVKGLGAIIMCSVLMINSVYATTYTLLNSDLVDSGKHLDWDSSTKYEKQLSNAVNTWNGYKKGIIRKDALNRVQDVKICDSSKNSECYSETIMFSGKIVLYTKHLDSFTKTERQAIITHEIGHALGIGHNDGDQTSIMKQGRQSQTTLGTEDKKAYDAAYKRY